MKTSHEHAVSRRHRWRQLYGSGQRQHQCSAGLDGSENDVRQQWKDVVLTMVDYGAPVGEKDVEVLTDYLTENLGKKQQ